MVFICYRLRYSRTSRNGLNTTKFQKSLKSSAETDFFVKNRAFPLYFTVDDLATHRRKKISDKRISDNLRPLSGKFCYKSEYKKKFRSFILTPDDSIINWKKKKMKTLDNLKLEANIEFNPEYTECYVDFPLQKTNLVKPIDQLELEGTKFSTSTEHKDKFVMFKEARKAALARQSTNLNVEGEFDGVSETKDKFKEYDKAQRAKLLRQSTELQLEGNIDFMTEKREKYIKFENVPKTKLIKRSSSLEVYHGECPYKSSEYNDSFQFPKQYEKASLIRSMENLHVEGKIEFDPEYKRNFVDHHIQYPNVKFKGRRRSCAETLNSASNEKFYGYCQMKDTIFDRNIKIDFSPEYKHSYTRFPVQHPVVKRPHTNLIPPSGIGETESEVTSKYKPFKVDKAKTLRPATNLKPEGKICFSPEYKKSFVNFKTDERNSGIEQENTNLHKSFDVLNHSNQNVDLNGVNRFATKFFKS